MYIFTISVYCCNLACVNLDLKLFLIKSDENN